MVTGLPPADDGSITPVSSENLKSTTGDEVIDFRRYQYRNYKS